MRTSFLSAVVALCLLASPVSAQNLSSGRVDGLLSSLSWENSSSAPSQSNGSSGAAGSADAAANPDASTPITDPVTGGTWMEDFEDRTGWTVHTNVLHSGEKRWEGWNFATIRDWTWAVGTDKRHYFTRGDGKVAIAESKHHRLKAGEQMTTELTSPSVPVTPGVAYQLEFDSHYRQGSSDNTAKVVLTFDTGESKTVREFTKDSFSTHEQVGFTAPSGAQSVSATFVYGNAQDDWFWAIDNVTVTTPLPADPGTPTAVVDVISDTHNEKKYGDVIDFLNRQPDPAGAMVVNGDYVDMGYAENYANFAADRAAHPHASGREYFTIGNHEMLGTDGSDTFLHRYLDMTKQDHVWREEVVDGQPLLMISTEFYDDVARDGKEPYVVLSDAQLNWLKQRLDYWEGKGKTVFLFSHLVLPYTVTSTHSPWYGNDFAELGKLNKVLQGHDNIVMFTSHTHASLTAGDWWGVYRGADKHGFPVVNTGAVKNANLPDGDYDEEVDPALPQTTGLRVKTYPDRVRVEAWDFEKQEMIRFHDFPIHS
ncbi:metallophosphoesterase family protein [Corynebacterium glucuronolyticum]